MKKFLILIFLASILSASGAERVTRSSARHRKPQQPKRYTLSSSVEFAKAFYAELNKEVDLPDPFDTGVGGDMGDASGGIHDREWSYKVPTTKFPPSRLSEVARRAHKQWDVGWVGADGRGGVNNRFSAQGAAAGSYIFIDAIAYTEADDTIILLLIRWVE